MKLQPVGKYLTVPVSELDKFGIIVSAGLSSNLEFERSMVGNGFTVVGIDPSDHIAQAVNDENSVNKRFERGFTLIRRLFTPAAQPNKRAFTDESGRPLSTCDQFIGVCPSKFIQLPSVGYCELTNIYNHISLITVDIKGEESKVLKCLQSIPFVCVKLYRQSIENSDSRYDRCLCAMEAHGYQVLDMTEDSERNCQEVLFQWSA